MDWKVTAMYFSATGTTKKIIVGIAEKLSENINGERKVTIQDFTLPDSRQEPKQFTANDIVVFGVPVYAGRVPNVLLKYLNSVAGNGALAIAVTVYGNRNYDDALIELTDILQANGFTVIAGGAFIGEHSFSKTLAKNRPDDQDMAIVKEFAHQLKVKLIDQNSVEPVEVSGNRPYRYYYIPKNEQGEPVDIRKVTPKTNDRCTNCGLCTRLCPMGSIDSEEASKMKGICIKCGACVKSCPVNAKYYDDKNYIRHKEELEIDFSHRREPELFI
ncbi:EFR1 family ferrodoxin [Sporomusa sphaeroides]|uniref:Flavodoxin n=1 Tax=Sporomusa sphaeroides DSM 2875 TaxID=1337886 RepID=A0ABM9W520_9FIRM|nr:EFR1 family ferrodoxin [Sporomusa sphaeroides]OLS56014.1 NAD(P)H-quinone oxidoreductase subunit I, chloroplastic [Sporomusa sphaeroides DSM 2875]CVK20225.1 flavodoxin [Sporomusa sphaeroides DSM 2875]